MTITKKIKKLDKNNIEDIFALTPMQEGILFHYLKEPGSEAYYEQLSLEIIGNIDIKCFQGAWNFVIETNEMLRTVFRWENMANPVQIVLKKHNLRVECFDFSGQDKHERKKVVEAMKRKDREKKFNLEDVPFRVTLYKVATNRHEMIISNHHIIYDGWSNGIILGEFFSAYHDLVEGKPLKPLVKTKFKEFVRWTQTQDINKQERYWYEYLNGFDQSAELAVKTKSKGPGHFRKEVGDYSTRFSTLTKRFSTLTKDRIEGFTRDHKITLAPFIYCAWGVLLQIYNNIEDITLGTTVSGRSAQLKGIENMVGLFINTLPLRIWSLPNEKAIDLIVRIQQVLKQREEYDCTSLVDIRKYSELGNRAELFDLIVAVENYPLEKRMFQKNSHCPLNVDSYSMVESTNYDLYISIIVSHDMVVNVNYSKNCFNETIIRNMANHFIRIVHRILQNPGIKINQIEILSEEEKETIIYTLNAVLCDYPENSTIHKQFEEQVKKTPGHVAVVFGNQYLTYKELNQWSNQLARTFRNKGVNPGTNVGLIVEFSSELLIGILAVLKAGGTYVPIDPGFPQKRIKYILRESDINILLVNSQRGRLFDEYDVIDLNNARNYKNNGNNLEPYSQSRDLAYIIFTSGTTGKPKGVMIEHRSVINFIEGVTKEIPFVPGESLLSLTSISFDIFVLETLLPLIKGVRVVIGSQEERLNSEETAKIIEKQNITILQVTPSRLQLLLEGKAPFAFKKLAYLIVGGEAFPRWLLEKIRTFAPGQIYNMYGPTETTVWSTLKNVSTGPLDIGKPILNTQVYILSKENMLQPIAVPGELCIAGHGLARGYLNRPELTNEKFCLRRPGGALFEKTAPPEPPRKNFLLKGTRGQGIQGKEDLLERALLSSELYPRPFAPVPRLYKTGDLAKWLPDGNIEFLGRLDHQVKIRGFRVELAEIEQQLMNYPGIKEAVVIVKENPGKDHYLCAFIVCHREPDVPGLRRYLSGSLPEYMIPADFIRLEKIPLNSNGKVDRKALVSHSTTSIRSDARVKYMVPRSEIEKLIADSWKEVLQRERVGIDDHFFDVGGNSLTLIRLNSRLNKQFKKNISMTRMFRYPTIRSLAQYIKGEEETTRLRMPEPLSWGKVEEAAPKGKKELDIAVIGMACRFPGADHIDQFWENLINGKESISFFTDAQLQAAGIDPQELTHSHYVKAKGCLNNIHCFDSTFFGYSSREAEQMDPQVRIFHQCAWEALEDAGYDPEAYSGLIGLYAGASASPLWEAALLSSSTGGTFVAQWESLQYRDKDFLSSRVAHKLNLKGPAISLHTACSTSLVAIDAACRGLLSGQCHLALAGAVSITLQDEVGYWYQESMIMSPDGHCRAFEAAANGTVSGNGVGVVVLKPLSRAISEGDHVYAVIKGSAVNNDGLDKVGYTAPAIEGQAAVICAALRSSGVEPESIGYLEAHGTGTPLGDPTEIEGLTLAFDTLKRNYCAIGSVKTNIGHLDTAAGVAGFIKTVLALKHRKIPPNLHFEAPNPKIDFATSPFYVNTRLREWLANDYPRRAGVSSFGIGGTNAHVILEEAPQGTRGLAPLFQPPEYQLILLSARTPSAVEKMSQNLADYFKKNPDINLAEAAYTLQMGRRVFSHRHIAVCSDVKEAIALLSDPGSGGCQSGVADNAQPTLIFLFPGQGSQYVNMALELYQKEPGFREEMDCCFEILNILTDYNLKEILYPGEHKAQSAERKANKRHALCAMRHAIDQTEIAQPLIFSIEYALAKRLMTWGIKPQAMMGHSIGEYAAACLSGVFSLEDALKLVVLRGKLMQQMPGGGMLSVSFSQQQLSPLLDEINGSWSYQQVWLAAVNSTSLCTVSGSHEAITAFEKKLAERGYHSRRLHTSHAFHSPMMAPMLLPFKEAAAKVTGNAPKIPFISNITGDWFSGEEAVDPDYWGRHLCSMVRFSDGIEKLVKKKNALFLEVGPGQVLSTLVRKHRSRLPHQVAIQTLRHPEQQVSDWCCLLMAVGRLWLCGIPVQWSALWGNQKRYRVSLPTYPFESQPYPFRIASTLARFRGVVPTVVEGEVESPGDLGQTRSIPDWFYVPVWRQEELSASHRPPHIETGPWLVFIDRWGTRLRERLMQQHSPVVTVTPSTSAQSTNDTPGQYTLNPRHPGDYNHMVQRLKKTVGIPQKILHLWNVGEDCHCPGNPQEVSDLQERGFYSLIHLACALGKESLENSIDILVVSKNMQEVTGGDLHQPYGATVAGAVAIIPLEYPNIAVSSIDIDIQDEGQGEDEIINHLYNELIAVPGTQFTALRQRTRWVQGFQSTRWETSPGTPARLRGEGVYLITGGLGGIGLELAEYLAKAVQARLILIQRSPFPPREEWAEWLATHPEQNPTSTRIKKLKTLETIGAQVLALTADVTDEQAMRQVKAQVLERFGVIHGVIHCAGVPGGGMIQGRSRENFQKVLAPKLIGTWVLDSLFHHDSLDFFILCSSINAVVPYFGQSAYTAANAFLDAYAHYNRSHNPKWSFTVSINWDTWQDKGMAGQGSHSQTKIDLHHPLLRWLNYREGQQGVYVYISRLTPSRQWVLDEHRVTGKAVLPGTAYLEMAVAAITYQVGPVSIEVQDLYFSTPLVVEESEEREIHTIVKRTGVSSMFEFSIFSLANSPGTREPIRQLHAAGKAGVIQESQPEPYDLAEIEDLCPVRLERRETSALISFGPRWSNVKRVSYGKGQGMAVLELPIAFSDDIPAYRLHPALLDMATVFLQPCINREGRYLPFGYKKVRIHRPLPGSFISFARHMEKPGGSPQSHLPGVFLEFAIILMTETGEVLVEIEGFSMKQVSVFDAPNFRLNMTSPGNLETLFFQPAPWVEPGPGEVEIEVQATGLNFKEVLYALGILPAPGETGTGFGMECSGRITARGEGVTDFNIGDAVIAYGTSFFCRRNIVSTSNISLMPLHSSFEEAATIPVAFMTAYYALVQLARLSKGERVLIHSAAGGVGLAAVKIAQWKEAEIFATAGTTQKRQYLHSIGIQHVMDSHSFSFADEVMTVTNGRGVDVLLNSLAGEFIPKGLSLMAPYGRFLEIGIRDILDNTALGLRPFEKSLSFFSISLSEKLPGFTSLLRQIVQHFNNRELTPLPLQVFPIDETARAFKTMARARHIGKIVVSQRSQRTNASAVEPDIKEKLNLEKGLLPHEGVEVFSRILGVPSVLTGAGKPFSQVIVSTEDLMQRLNGGQSVSDLPDPHPPDTGQLSSLVRPRPRLSTAYSPPVNKIHQVLTRIWEEYLGIDQVGIHDNFFELGTTSLDLIQISIQLEETLKKDIPTVTLFTYPTIHLLSGYLCREKTDLLPGTGDAKVLQEVKKGKHRLKKQRTKRM